MSLGFTLSLNDCGSPVNFIAGGTESWITPNPGGGTLLPGGSLQIMVFVDRSGLDPDGYSEQLLITSSLGNIAIPIFVEVEAPPCELTVSPTVLDFGTVNAPDSDEFEISLNDCGEGTTFDIRFSRGTSTWIFVDPSRGSLDSGNSVEIDVSVDPGPMPVGPQSEQLTISTDFGTFNVPVTACKQVPGGPACPR